MVGRNNPSHPFALILTLGSFEKNYKNKTKPKFLILAILATKPKTKKKKRERESREKEKKEEEKKKKFLRAWILGLEDWFLLLQGKLEGCGNLWNFVSLQMKKPNVEKKKLCEVLENFGMVCWMIFRLNEYWNY